jgi:NAD(P)-dependent dehydrogenase (short-subunit alcohol dehydrogenase family)
MPDHRASAVLVTGGTQGLGLAIAEALAADGCTRLALAGRDAERGAAAAARLRDRLPSGADVIFLPTDMADVGQVMAMVDRAGAHLGALTGLVNAAAGTDRGSILDTTPAVWDGLMAVNARGPFFAIQRFAQACIAAGRPGQVVNILSMVAHCGQSFLAPYSASKAALANVTKNAAQALRSRHIRVNGINCGWMDTPGEDATQRRWHGAGDDWLALAEGRAPLGMLVKPVHVAGLVSYMLSTDSGVMTGSVVDFDQNVAGSYPE